MVIKHSLPIHAFENVEDGACNIINTFFQIQEQLESFYNSLHKIDTLCYVLDPLNITPDINWDNQL